MELKGSCHCEKVSFKVLSHTPAPFMWCYCSICRKCQGGGGYAINVMSQYDTLEILTGKEHLKQYHAMRDKEMKELGGNIRFFCGECGTHLYAYDKEWGQWCYPFASCIDTPLPKMDAAADCYHIMQDSKPDWVPIPKGAKHVFDEYPNCSLEEWHKKHKQFVN